MNNSNQENNFRQLITNNSSGLPKSLEVLVYTVTQCGQDCEPRYMTDICTSEQILSLSTEAKHLFHWRGKSVSFQKIIVDTFNELCFPISITSSIFYLIIR